MTDDAVTVPPFVHGITEAQERLLATVAALDDEQAAGPSSLPGWTRDMLLAHVTAAGAAVVRCVETIAAGGQAMMYAGGESQRDAEIAAGRGLPARQLVDGLRSSCQRVDDALRSVTGEQWAAPCYTRRGPVSLSGVAIQRWIDVEAHLVDLDLGVTCESWPEDFVGAALPVTLTALPALRKRPDADQTVVGTWVLRQADGSGAWTVRATAGEASVTDDIDRDAPAIVAPGSALLAVLLGRRVPPGMLTEADVEEAACIKAAFPGP